ncbi:MAG: Abi family protein [Eubacterium sp.]
MDYDKPFKTYAEQMELIRSKNVLIKDTEFAEQALRNISYYTLINGYKNTFLSEDGSERFIDGVTIELLYTIHLLDNSFNNILFKNILYIERSLKTKLSYIVGRDYSICCASKLDLDNLDDYFHPNHYIQNRQRTNTLIDLRKSVDRCRHNTSTYYYKCQKNHIPPWIFVNDIPFGMAIRWYSILKSSAKDEICNEFIKEPLTLEDKKEFINNAFALLKDFRNGIAHGNKTFAHIVSSNLPKRQSLQLSPEIITSESECNSIIENKNSIFSAIISIMILLNDPYLLFGFVKDFVSLFGFYEEEDSDFAGKTVYEVFGLPNDIAKRLFSYWEMQ